MTKKTFLFVVAVFFSVHAILDFLRMMFDWSVNVGGVEVPTWTSGMLFIFSVFMVYWSFLISKEEKKPEEPQE